MDDVLGIVGMSFVGGAIFHGILWSLLKSHVAALLRNRSADRPNEAVSNEQLGVARRFHWTVFSLTLSWMPFALLATGNIACSLIRDAGYLIFPWAIVASSCLAGLGFSLAILLRNRRLASLLSPAECGEQEILAAPPSLLENVTVYDPASQTYTEIPAVELAPGMVRAQVKGREGIVWIDPSQMKQGGYQHPPFEGVARDAIQSIQAAFPEVYEKSYEFWEDGFRRDHNPENEIGLWLHIAKIFSEQMVGKPLDFRRELFSLLVACSNSDLENISIVFERKVLSKSDFDRVVESYFGKTP